MPPPSPPPTGDSELREKEVPKEQGKEALPEAAKEGEEEAMQVQEEEEEEEDGVPDETFIANATSVSSATTGKPFNTPTSTNAGPYNTSSLSASQATVVHKVMLNEVMPVIIKCLTHKVCAGVTGVSIGDLKALSIGDLKEGFAKCNEISLIP